ncbi:MAG: DUF4349 domain-containing protein [Lachnospiraceae bacterium]|nr:DUF4349 domain-containing protein [Lachnospiraceae bacterium]
MKRRVISIALVFGLTAAVLAGCGGSSSSDSGSYKAAAPAAESSAAADYAYAPEYEEEVMSDDIYEYDTTANSAGASEGSGAPTDSQIQSNSNRKLIKTVNLSAETKEFDKLIANVSARITALGGYAESMNIQGSSYDNSVERRTAYIVARIPANNLDQFVQSVTDESNIASKNESAEDVTLQYADVEAHKDSLKIEQKRLNELLEQADTLENIIELENRLTEVRYEIESYESRLRTMNNQVQYSTVNLNVSEVKDYTPEPVEEETFGERVANGFLESCEDAWDTIQDFIVGFVSFLPMLVVLILILGVVFAIVFGIVKLIIAIVKSSGKKKAAKAPAKAAAKPVTATALPNPPEKKAEPAKEDNKENK